MDTSRLWPWERAKGGWWRPSGGIRSRRRPASWWSWSAGNRRVGHLVSSSPSSPGRRSWSFGPGDGAHFLRLCSKRRPGRTLLWSPGARAHGMSSHRPQPARPRSPLAGTSPVVALDAQGTVLTVWSLDSDRHGWSKGPGHPCRHPVRFLVVTSARRPAAGRGRRKSPPIGCEEAQEACSAALGRRVAPLPGGRPGGAPGQLLRLPRVPSRRGQPGAPRPPAFAAAGARGSGGHAGASSRARPASALGVGPTVAPPLRPWLRMGPHRPLDGRRGPGRHSARCPPVQGRLTAAPSPHPSAVTLHARPGRSTFGRQQLRPLVYELEHVLDRSVVVEVDHPEVARALKGQPVRPIEAIGRTGRDRGVRDLRRHW